MVAARNADQKPLLLYIPDTVVFRYQRPAALYTNDSVEEHQVACRDELSDLSAEALYQRFVARKESPDRVCALYVYVDRHGQDNEDSADPRRGRDAQRVVVEYMNPPQLRQFLQHRHKENNGILQRFLPSKGAFHTTIRVMWTPRTCHIETRANRHKMNDMNLSVIDRYSTFDGGPHLSMSHNLKDGLFYKNIKEAADSIVRHIEALILRPYQVWETVMYFKYCAPERGASEKVGISFLWCSSLRVFKDELLDLRRLDEFWTSDQKIEVMINKEAPDKDSKVLHCPITGNPYKDGTSTEVKVGTLVKYMNILAKTHPNALETLKFAQEAADLDEQASSKETVGARGSSKNSGEEAIRENVSELMQKKTSARDVCDLIKRVLFGNPESADAEKLRAILSHKTFLQESIAVSEDAALDSALVVQRESVRTKAKSTPSNDVAQLLSRGARAHLKRPGAVTLMPASVVEVKSVLVGHGIAGGSQLQKVRAGLSRSPVDSLLSHGTLTKGTLSCVGMLSHINVGESVHPNKHVDLDLGTSKILSFRRLKFLPMGAPAVRGPITMVEQPFSMTGARNSPTDEHREERQQHESERTRLNKINSAVGGGVYSKLSAQRPTEDNQSADDSLDSIMLRHDSIGLAEARHKVLGQYAAFDKNDRTKRPPPLRLDHETLRAQHPCPTRMNSRPAPIKGISPKVQRPNSEYIPKVRDGQASGSRAPLSLVSVAYHQGEIADSGHEQSTHSNARASGIKHYKVLDSDWSDALHDKHQRNRVLAPPSLTDPGHRQSSAKSRHMSAGLSRIASAQRRDRALASSSASTRVSSATSAGRVRRAESSAHQHDNWSDGDLIEDDDNEDWDDGLEMDLPSTHSRLKRDRDLRASREAERMLRSSGEQTPSGHSMPLCLQWGLDDRVRAKVLQQYSAFG